MASRKKKTGSTIFVWLVVLAVLAGIGWWLWMHRARFAEYMLQNTTPSAPQSAAGEKTGDVIHLRGKLQVVTPPRDTALGVSADAVVLLRIVEMYQWHEQCDGDACRYGTMWSRMQINSNAFHERNGHENPRAPFSDARFQAGELKLGEFSVDAALAAGQRAPIDYPVPADALPPNLAATFSVVDGFLYAGGNPAHPQPGTLRIRYRIIPAGEVEITGVKYGHRVEAK